MQNFKDYYKILGVKKDSSPDEVKQAFRKLARKYHPDVNPNDASAEELFKDINEAYEVLSDTAKRRQYDQFGSYYQQGGFRGNERPPGPTGSDDFGGGGFGGPVDFGQFDDFQDFIDQLLGRVGRDPQPNRGYNPDAAASYDAEANINLTIPEAYEGGRRRLRVEGGRILEVNIPPGITPGKKIRLRGQGHPSPNGGAGDLYLKVDFKEHPFYRLEGSDLACELPISPSEAALGAQVEVPTLDGAVKLRIPAGIQSGQKLRLSNKGFPKGGGARGDQFISVLVMVPEKLTTEERDLYEQLLRVQSYNPRANITL